MHVYYRNIYVYYEVKMVLPRCHVQNEYIYSSDFP